MDNDMINVLSAKQKQVVANILSIQDFYNFTDHCKLISIIINKKQSQKFFQSKKVMISDVFQGKKQTLNQQSKANIFAEKYTYENLVQKFKKPRSFRNNILLKILRKKMQNQVIGSHQTRKKVWLLASGALFSMNNNKGLFQGLINYKDYPSYYQKSIKLDLNRTVKKSQSSEEQIQSLHNILTAFSRRNPYIGYCQGLNFIAFFLLTMQFTEQQCFWILSQIVETIIPMDYYTNMIGVACDQQIFLDILKLITPSIPKKFQQVGFDGSVLSIQWFVCLFTSSLPFYLVKVVWDRLLVEGTIAFIKAGLILLNHFEDEILQTTQFFQIITLIEQGTKNLKLQENEFNREFDKIYINQQGLQIARQLYRQFHIKEKLAEKVVSRKTQKQPCSLEWPLCIDYIEKCKKNKFDVQIWTYRQQGSPKLIHDYLQRKSQIKTSSSSTLIEKSEGNGSASKMKKIETPDYIIGRMQHICNQQNSQKMFQKKKKDKKNAKFLSMILETDEEDEKKVQNLKKLLRLSSVDQNFENFGEEEEKEKEKFEKSETIFFYNKFVQDNYEIAEMLASKKK